MNDKFFKKWEPTGLLQGLDNDLKRQTDMAELLEREAKWICSLPDYKNAKQNIRGIPVGGVPKIANIAFPLVRRIFGDSAVSYEFEYSPKDVPVQHLGVYTREFMIGEHLFCEPIDYNPLEDGNFLNGLDEEVEWCHVMAERVIDIFSRCGRIVVGNIPLFIIDLPGEGYHLASSFRPLIPNK